MTWRSALVAALLLACGGPRPPGEPAPTAPPAPCPARDDAAAALAEGRLTLARERADEAVGACRSPASLRLRAQVLGELGLDESAAAAWRELAAAGGAAERTEADAALRELAARPPPVRARVPEPERQLALAMYREGVDQRLAGHTDAALVALRRSYQLLPHPLTIVQIGLVHAA
ncbi:MAG TPA: hypothetical protein VL172_07165, partial [Kofleriaceae bacterium]|nr:hypothetical protein [Kofleriaceae bacterium]